VRAASVAVLLLCAAAPRALADVAEAEARKHFIAGTREYQLGEFKQAAEEYKAAFRAKSDPVLLYNIAQALRLGGDLTQALFFYQSYLRSVPSAANKAEIDERIRKLQEQIKANQAPPNSTLSPEGKATSPPVAPAPVEVVIPAPAVHTEAPPPPPDSSAAAPAAATVATSPPPKKTPVYKKWWLWTTVGVVVVGAGLGIGLGLGLRGGAPSSHLGTAPIF